MTQYELILGMILIATSLLSMVYYDHAYQTREQRYLLEKKQVAEDKQFALAMYNEVRKAVCVVIRAEQLLPVYKRSFINISYPCPNALE
jgi:hypothetical protein